MPSPLSLLGLASWFLAGFCMGAGWQLSAGLIRMLSILFGGH